MWPRDIKRPSLRVLNSKKTQQVSSSQALNPTCLLPRPGLGPFFFPFCNPSSSGIGVTLENGALRGKGTLKQWPDQGGTEVGACPPPVCPGCPVRERRRPADACPACPLRGKVKRGPEGLGRLISSPRRTHSQPPLCPAEPQGEPPYPVRTPRSHPALPPLERQAWRASHPPCPQLPRLKSKLQAAGLTVSPRLGEVSL